jgi:L-seryl-tRNA(Ser) seleniumtransferase
MDRDRFGNPHAPALAYARGRILASTEDDFRKLAHAWSLIRRHGPEAIFVFTGLEHGLAMTAEELRWADDELAPAIYLDRLTALTLEHLGGSAEFHDVAVFNRLTGATLATHLTLVRPGDVVVGVSASHSHPTVIRAAAQAGARFVDTVGAEAFARALEREAGVTLVVLTRLAVTYELMSLDAIRTVVKLAHDKGARVYVDDAGGARVAPAAFEHPRMLELGVDVGATGLDKYGTIGPRFGLMAGDKTLVGRIRAKGFECGLEARPMLYAAVVRTLEQYRPERVRELIATTRRVADALRPIFGPRLHETPTTAQLLADDLLALAMERGGVTTPPVVPYEAAAAFCMILLEEHRMLTVHFVGMPPGTADILFKFVRPETLERFGGPQKFAQAVDGAVTRLGSLLREPERLTSLLFGAPSTGSRSAPPPPRPSS